MTGSATRSPGFYAWLSVATSLATVGLKFAAWHFTGSVGLLSDAIESLVNLAAALVVLFTLAYARQAADRDHNFGHEKAEYFSSGIEGALILVAAGAIIATAVPKLMHPTPLEAMGLGLVLSLLAAAANAACAWTLLQGARAHRSITLEADAQHLLSDVWTTAGVIVAVLLVFATGWLWLDPLIAIAVAIQVLFAGWGLIRRSFDGLMDKSIPEQERRAIEAALDSVRREGCDFHQLRTRQAASKHFADVHLLVPGTLTVQQGHDLMERIEREVARTAPNVELLIHLEPLEDPKSWDEPGKPMVGS